MTLDIEQITKQLLDAYDLENPICKDLGTPTNDVIQVTSQNSRFALKLYTVTTSDEIQWEIDLILHLLERDVPVVRPVPSKTGYLNTFVINGEERIGVLFEWAAGEKPEDSRDTYTLIGKAAAQIHQAADSFSSSLPHTKYDAAYLIDEQLERIHSVLIETSQLQRMTDLAERLRSILNNPALDYGACHMDLKPDNIHMDADKLTVFDFNSSGESWRAIEPYRILKLSDDYFNAWLEGYRSIRPFSETDEKAVAAFGIIGDIRSVVWDLGLARSSRGEPLLQASDLPKIIDGWLEWERDKIDVTNPDTPTFADTYLAQKVTKDTYPDAKQITLIEHGYDNIVVLVDDQYALRFPRNQDAYARGQYEKQVLRHLETLETISVPKVLGEHANPPYLLTSFVAGKHLSPKDIRSFPIALQQELGESIAKFAYGMHTAFSVEEVRRIRKELRLDERPEEPWPIYFERLLSDDNLLTSEQDVVAKEYYKKWKQISTSASPLIVVHDDLHTENMLFKDDHLCGVLDFGDTNIGTAEQDLRQLYRINETVLNAAASKYSKLSGRQLDIEAIKLWAIMQELASYAERLLTENTNHPAFTRASGNLNMWLKTDIWGKGLVNLEKTSSYQ